MKNKNIYYHIILILLLLLIPVLSSPELDSSLRLLSSSFFQRDFSRYVLLIFFFYLNLVILLPALYDKRRLYRYWTSVFVSYILICTLPFFMFPDNHGSDPKFDFFQNQISDSRKKIFKSDDFPPHPEGFSPEERAEFEKQHSPPMPRIRHFEKGFPPPPHMRKEDSFSRKYMSGILPFLFSFLSSFFLYQSIKKKEVERAKAKADLLNLRYQLQPHFLFNTLNSIYSLILMKSDDASEGILKLSNVMRYIVEESENDYVLLSKELFYIKDYIALQLIRTDSSLDFTYTENGVNDGVKIVPMILLNYIENAFKYGYNAEESSKISIDLNLVGDQLNFKVFNNIVNYAAADESTKVGMKNTSERLEKLYPGKYSLDIKEDKKSYFVELNLDLSS